MTVQPLLSCWSGTPGRKGSARSSASRGRLADRPNRQLLADELARGATDPRFRLRPQRIVAETRAALGRSDIVLADTGAVEMWMARLYPTYEPDTCVLPNGLSTMSFALPGAIGARLASGTVGCWPPSATAPSPCTPRRSRTAPGQRVPMAVLVWVDDAYGLIEWKVAHELGHATAIRFTTPDVVGSAESFGATGWRVDAAGRVGPALREALAADTVSVIACPVDYRENLRRTDSLGELSGPFDRAGGERGRGPQCSACLTVSPPASSTWTGC